VLFAAATGLRPGEWMALEQRDIDRQARVVYVRRALRNGRLKSTKTEGSIRAVPLQAIAPLRYFDLHNFRERYWKPAQIAAASRRRAASTISATRSQPSRSAPASQPSTSRATWVPA
jgi:integrase